MVQAEPCQGRRARDFPRLPIESRGFLLFLEAAATAPATIASGRVWRDDRSPFACWLERMHFRVVRLTDYTVEIGAGEGRAYCQHRYKLPLWAQRFHRQLRERGRAGEQVSREVCLEIARGVLPRHALHESPLQGMTRRRRQAVDRATDHLPLGPRADAARRRAWQDADRLW
jgi:hypothetical protein